MNQIVTCIKAEDDLEFGGDLMKISQHCSHEEVDEDIGGRKSTGLRNEV